uniref:Uncharacterized protein n=1 Tax=Avena sativa TaxID=4498 RepID=A0ACD5WY46_AVESA
MFIVELGLERDRDRIWERSPWMVSKFAVVLEKFDFRSRPSDLKFEILLIWVRVLDLPYNKLNEIWGEKIAGKVGNFVKLDSNKNGLISAQYLRARVFIKVKEPLMRWVGLDSKRLNKTFWYAIQYEFLPYFCFSCGLLGHSDTRCPTPSERDVNGNLPWGPSLRAPNDKRKKAGFLVVDEGYDDFSYYYDQEYAENEHTENDLGATASSDKHQPFCPYHGGGRGRGGFQGTRGGKPVQVYHRLNMSPVVATGADATDNRDKDLAMVDPSVSGNKRDEAEHREKKEGCLLTPRRHALFITQAHRHRLGSSRAEDNELQKFELSGAWELRGSLRASRYCEATRPCSAVCDGNED